MIRIDTLKESVFT